MVLWLIGYLVILAGFIASDDNDEMKWYHGLMLLIIWPLILGSILNDIHEHCRKKEEKEGRIT